MRTPSALLLLCALSFAGGDAEFANDLFARLAARETNVVCSPLSVRVALAMACGGARGATAAEMEKVLRCDAGIHEALGRVARDYDGKERGEVRMPALANAAWVQKDASLLPAYLDLVGKRYLAALEALDFGDADAACLRINGWVAERTYDRIREIVDPSMFSVNTTLVLANAIHFKAAWARPFSARATREQAFTLASSERVQVPFLAQTERFPYAERDGAQAVELPYEGGRFSMVLVLPAVGIHPTAVPVGLLDALEAQAVTVHLPKFAFETGFRLEETLGAMGMPLAFTPRADFSGIDGAKDLYIAVVAHKAFVAVDEKGTEAAAATAVVLERKGGPAAPKVFRADRPFLFLVRDRETGAILFLGRVSDPR